METSTASIYDKWFVFADTDNDGRLSGQDAVKFFERSNLPRETLAKQYNHGAWSVAVALRLPQWLLFEVWALADWRKDGYLGRQTFHKAMELIAMAQKGLELTHDGHEREANNGLELAKMDGMSEITASISAQPAKPISSYEPGIA